jgi:uncharacterized protein YndB with AHSA1/START domain
MTTGQPSCSDDAVFEATGRDWAAWVALLDGWGARDLSHPDIVRLLRDEGLVQSAWWRQQVTGGYERLIHRRAVGEVAGAGFQIGVSKTLPAPAERVWALLTSAEGLALWLGDLTALPSAKGERVETAEGGIVELRSHHPVKRLRLAWQPPGAETPTILQVTVDPKGDRCALRFHQEKLTSTEAREAMRAHWKRALGVVAAAL